MYSVPHLCWHEGLYITVNEAHGVELVGRHQRAPQLGAAVERLRLHLLLGNSVRHKLVNDHGHLQEGVGALQEQTTRNKTSRHASSSSVSSPATRANMYGCWSSRSPTRMPY
jgi:hypothetical protein